MMNASLLPLLGLLCACATDAGVAEKMPVDPPRPGKWVVPATGKAITLTTLLDDLAARPAVLLGESHTSSEDHRWQLQILAAFHGRIPNLVLGFEAFPRRLQPVLDRWAAGELDQQAFLEQAEWQEVWGFPPSLYMPLFDFARMNRIPMVALNVDRGLVARVAKDGWDAIPSDAREGLGDPAPPSQAYVEILANVYAQHRHSKSTEPTMGGAAENQPPTLADAKFRHFVEAQITWDRAMAEAVAAAQRRPGRPVVIGIVGRGHVEYGFGIPHQLAALGLSNAAVLVTWPDNRDVGEWTGGGMPVADAVFGTAEEEPATSAFGPQLGVRLGTADDGVRVENVADGSVAAAAGLRKDDVIREAAGQPTTKPIDLAVIIHRQPSGTWLPLTVERGGRVLKLIAKFPIHPHSASKEAK